MSGRLSAAIQSSWRRAAELRAYLRSLGTLGACDDAWQGQMRTLDRITNGTFPIQTPPSIKGTGITLSSVLAMLASGKTAADIVANEPSLEIEDIQAAWEFLWLYISQAPATAAASRLGLKRRELVALLGRLSVPRPITK